MSIVPKPLLAQTYTPKRFTTPCYVQPKLNGVRAIFLNGRFYSRDGHEWRPEILTHLTTSLQQVPKGVALDGELYVHGWSLQRINAAIAVKRIAPTDDTRHVQFHVFDLVDHNLSFEERWGQAWDLVEQHKSGCLTQQDSIQIVPVQSCNLLGTVEHYFNVYTCNGYEGAMIRVGKAGYPTPGNGADQDNRSWQLLKRKGWLDGEYKCVDVVRGTGQHEDRMGALMLQLDGTNKTFQVGTGFSVAERDQYWNNPDEVIGSIVKIKYRFLSNDGIPNHTSFEEIL